jgi:hypothetical protein
MLPKGIDIWDFAATVFLFGFCAVALVFMVHTMISSWRENKNKQRDL